jgi:hypothetical protein
MDRSHRGDRRRPPLDTGPAWEAAFRFSVQRAGLELKG